jgi:hypothetical protein
LRQRSSETDFKKMQINCLYNSVDTSTPATGFNCTAPDLAASGGFFYGELLTNYFLFVIIIAGIFGFVYKNFIRKR